MLTYFTFLLLFILTYSSRAKASSTLRESQLLPGGPLSQVAFRDKVKLWIQTVIFYVILYLFCILKIKSKLKVNLVNANIFYILIIIHFDIFFQSQSQLYLKRVILTLTKSLFLPLSLTIYILFPFSRFSIPSLYFSGVTTTLLRWS